MILRQFDQSCCLQEISLGLNCASVSRLNSVVKSCIGTPYFKVLNYLFVASRVTVTFSLILAGIFPGFFLNS